jgi:hypothetical protein
MTRAVVLPHDVAREDNGHLQNWLSACDAYDVAGRDHEGGAPRPGIAPGASGGVGIRLEVDGEVFELCPDEFAGTRYTWVSGPDPGYGFSVSPTTEAMAEHEANIRNFLSMIDPRTGYLEVD